MLPATCYTMPTPKYFRCITKTTDKLVLLIVRYVVLTQNSITARPWPSQLGRVEYSALWVFL